MKKRSEIIKNSLLTFALLATALGASLLCHRLNVEEHITTVFVFAIFLISLSTKGYVYGIVAAFIGTIAINYAFTFPYFALNFTIPVNLISGIVMVTVSVLTSTLTTQLKQHETARAESEKERMRANLLRAVSHDLRTPLTTIYGSSTTLLENGNAMSDAQKDTILTGIKEDSEWLVRMVENLLSITRIDSGEVEIIKASTVLEELIDAVVLKFKKINPDQKITIEIPEELIIIPMDVLLIEQVLINLLENAVQHAKGMTKLTLRVFTIGDQAIFEIRDNGCGIEPKLLETIFSGYYASKDQVADSKKKNAGIGLSVCATIIKAHGGSIKAENAKTGGAVFRFSLATEEPAYDTE